VFSNTWQAVASSFLTLKTFQIREDEELTNFELCTQWWNNSEIANQMNTLDEKDQELSQPDYDPQFTYKQFHKINSI
jgi:hypothetical protein